MSYFGRSSAVSLDTRSVNDSIIYYIVTNNMVEIRKLVKKDNVNIVIDSKNKYTALHYAVMTRNADMIRYFFQLDAEPTIKNGEGQDAFEMSIRYQIKTLFDEEFADKNKTIKELQTTINQNNSKIELLEKRIVHERGTMEILQNKLTTYVSSSAEYKSKYDTLLIKSNDTARELKQLNFDYTELKKSNDTLKRKYVEQDIIVNNLLDANKKKK